MSSLLISERLFMIYLVLMNLNYAAVQQALILFLLERKHDDGRAGAHCGFLSFFSALIPGPASCHVMKEEYRVVTVARRAENFRVFPLNFGVLFLANFYRLTFRNNLVNYQ